MEECLSCKLKFRSTKPLMHNHFSAESLVNKNFSAELMPCKKFFIQAWSAMLPWTICILPTGSGFPELIGVWSFPTLARTSMELTAESQTWVIEMESHPPVRMLITHKELQMVHVCDDCIGIPCLLSSERSK